MARGARGAGGDGSTKDRVLGGESKRGEKGGLGLGFDEGVGLGLRVGGLRV